MTTAVLFTATITMESRSRIGNRSTPSQKDIKARKSSPCFQTFKLLFAKARVEIQIVVYVRSTFSSSLRRPLILALAYPSTYFSHLYDVYVGGVGYLASENFLCSVSNLIFSQLHVSSRCEFLEI